LIRRCNSAEPAKKSGQNIPKNRCRTTIAEPIGENASGTALYRGSVVCFKPRPGRWRGRLITTSRNRRDFATHVGLGEGRLSTLSRLSAWVPSVRFHPLGPLSDRELAFVNDELPPAADRLNYARDRLAAQLVNLTIAYDTLQLIADALDLADPSEQFLAHQAIDAVDATKLR